MASSKLSTATITKRLAIADQLLSGFDVQDGQSREFLRQAIASGQSPPEAIKELQDIALMRGEEEFTMALQCANALARPKKESKKAKRLSKKRSAKHTSHFWDGGEDMRDAASTAGSAKTSSFKAFAKFDELANKLREVLSVSTIPIKAVVDFERFDKLVQQLKEDLETSSKALESVSSNRQTVAVPKQAPVSAPPTSGRSLREKTPAVARQTPIPVPMIPDNGLSNDHPHHRDSHSHCHPTLPPTDFPQSHDIALPHPDVAPPDPQPPRHHRIIRTERAIKATSKTKTSPFFSTSPQTPSPPLPSPAVTQEEDQEGQAQTPLTNPPPPPPTPKRPRAKPPPGILSSLPIPPLTSLKFGLIQEELAHSPFYLLVAVTFLIKTAGKTAIPVFWDLIQKISTPEALTKEENKKEVIELIKPLGLSEHRYAIMQKYARGFVENPPTKDKRYGVKNYPLVGDGRDIVAGEVFGGEDLDGDFNNDGGGGGGLEDDDNVMDMVKDRRERAIGQAWEIGHLTQGAYTLDSWRIFCRDVLLGRAENWTGKGGRGGEGLFQPEWMRVLPKDKELRACLRWMWMREGWEWDPVTGDREPLREELREAVDEGRVGYDDNGSLVILTSEPSAEVM